MKIEINGTAGSLGNLAVVEERLEIFCVKFNSPWGSGKYLLWDTITLTQVFDCL